jgi:hypothetical protein
MSLEEECLEVCYQSISKGQAPGRLPFGTDCSLIMRSPSPQFGYGDTSASSSNGGGSYVKDVTVGGLGDHGDVSLLDTTGNQEFERTTAASDDSRQVRMETNDDACDTVERCTDRKAWTSDTNSFPAVLVTVLNPVHLLSCALLSLGEIESTHNSST